MTDYYARIGNRRTPSDIQKKMTSIARTLAEHSYILRSGAAEGADLAFELGSKIENHCNGLCQIFLPWAGFNNRPRRHPYFYPPTQEAIELAKKFHPAWDKCSQAAKLLYARNSHQILGPDLNTPVDFVICWHPGYGGTMQAVRIADHYEIPVYNLKDPDILSRIDRLVWSEINLEKE